MTQHKHHTDRGEGSFASKSSSSPSTSMPRFQKNRGNGKSELVQVHHHWLQSPGSLAPSTKHKARLSERGAVQPPLLPWYPVQNKVETQDLSYGKLFFNVISSSISIGMCEGQCTTYSHTWSRNNGTNVVFYLVTAPENTSSGAVVVVGDRTTTVFLSHRHAETSSHSQVIKWHGPMGLQAPLSWNRVAWRQPATIRGQQELLELSVCISNCWLNTKQNHKMATNCPHSDPHHRHSRMPVIFDTPDLFIRLTGTILTRIYSRTLGQLANHFIYMFLLPHLHIWTTACACGCTAIIYIWLHSHKPSVKSLGFVMARPKHERNHPFNLL